MKEPQVSISIPTYNSEAFITKCLDAVYAQTYKNIEVNIVDGYSKDATRELANRYPVNFSQDKLGLLNARKIGTEQAQGEYVLLLDSDQILEPDTIERAVLLVQSIDLDMLVLEEDVYRAHTLLEKLFQLDRMLIHTVKDFSPYTGVMLPRFYKKELLSRSFAQIPKASLMAGGQDHAIIYFEAWQISQKVDLLPKAVKHIEPSTLREIIPKFYRWGKTSKEARADKYKDMLGQKESFRKGLFSHGLMTASFASILLLLIKGVPYKLGEFASKFEPEKV